MNEKRKGTIKGRQKEDGGSRFFRKIWYLSDKLHGMTSQQLDIFKDEKYVTI
jgi:hypothetical protein